MADGSISDVQSRPLHVHNPDKEELIQLVPVIQAALMEILEAVIDVCERNDIDYMLTFGTLLGAVRHEGFIPWDDDIDIAMLRPEYERFLIHAQAELGPRFFLQTHETDPVSALPFAKIRKNQTIYREAPYADWDMHQGLFVDVFPYDKIPKSRILQKIHSSLMIFGKKLRNLRLTTGDKPDIKQRSHIKSLLIRTGKRVLSLVPLPVINSYIAGVPKLFRSARADEVAIVALSFSKSAYQRQSAPIRDVSCLESRKFARLTVKVPCGYHEVLSRMYGDYMECPPVEQRFPKHNPAEVLLP